MCGTSYMYAEALRMEIRIVSETAGTTLFFDGRLDTQTSPKLEADLAPILKESKNVMFDFAKLDYLSSAGLRVILSTHKKLKAAGGTLTVTNVNDVIKNVFDLTGFSDILHIV